MPFNMFGSVYRNHIGTFNDRQLSGVQTIVVTLLLNYLDGYSN